MLLKREVETLWGRIFTFDIWLHLLRVGPFFVHIKCQMSRYVPKEILVFAADVSGFKEHGAVLCYEVAAE